MKQNNGISSYFHTSLNRTPFSIWRIWISAFTYIDVAIGLSLTLFDLCLFYLAQMIQYDFVSSWYQTLTNIIRLCYHHRLILYYTASQCVTYKNIRFQSFFSFIIIISIVGKPTNQSLLNQWHFVLPHIFIIHSHIHYYGMTVVKISKRYAAHSLPLCKFCECFGFAINGNLLWFLIYIYLCIFDDFNYELIWSQFAVHSLQLQMIIVHL